jgi:hypothetical protein
MFVVRLMATGFVVGLALLLPADPALGQEDCEWCWAVFEGTEIDRWVCQEDDGDFMIEDCIGSATGCGDGEICEIVEVPLPDLTLAAVYQSCDNLNVLGSRPMVLADIWHGIGAASQRTGVVSSRPFPEQPDIGREQKGG